MPGATCCVVGCNNRHSASKKLRFYRIPRGKNQRSKFIKKIGRPSNWLPNSSTWICSMHFKSGKISKNHHDVDYIPTLLVEPARDNDRMVKFSAPKCLSNSELLEGAFRDHITHLIDEASIMLERREQEHLTQSLLFHDYVAPKKTAGPKSSPPSYQQDNTPDDLWVARDPHEELSGRPLLKHYTDDEECGRVHNNTATLSEEGRQNVDNKEDKPE
ncbi:uncharacterized protein LOC115220526 isoform X1 [Argonauta hians]